MGIDTAPFRRHQTDANAAVYSYLNVFCFLPEKGQRTPRDRVRPFAAGRGDPSRSLGLSEQQTLFCLRVKKMQQIAVEGEVDLGAIAETAALLFGQLGGGDAQDRIFAGSGHM